MVGCTFSRETSPAATDCTSQEFSQSHTDGGNDRNLRSGGDGTRESPCISDIFVANEDIDMFPHLSLLRCDAILNARVECPESRQRVGQSCGQVLDLDCTVSSGKFTQSTRNVKSDWHGSPFRSTRLAFRQRFRLM